MMSLFQTILTLKISTFLRPRMTTLLFVGRVNPGKGIHIALQIVEEVGGRLVVAGSGSFDNQNTRTDRPVSEYAELVGVVGPEERKRLMSRAKATLAPSTFLEPFCGCRSSPCSPERPSFPAIGAPLPNIIFTA